MRIKKKQKLYKISNNTLHKCKEILILRTKSFTPFKHIHPTHKEHNIVETEKKNTPNYRVTLLFLVISGNRIISCLSTWHQRIAICACWTLTNGQMTLWLTNCSDTALAQTRIDTRIVNASSIVGAFTVALAFAAHTVGQRVASVSGQTCANGSLSTCIIVAGCALGIDAAWIRCTKIFCNSESRYYLQWRKLADINKARNLYNIPLVKGRQLTNGSPVMSRGQLQTGVNPRRLQSAPTPHEPSHGFLQMP